MASTDPFQRADDDAFIESRVKLSPVERKRERVRARAELKANGGIMRRLWRRGAGVSTRVERKASRAGQRMERESAEAGTVVSGWPAVEGLYPVLSFLALPALVVMMITVTGGHWPAFILYPVALCLGLIVAVSALRGVELVLACLIIYMPFSKVFVVPIAPGINGTNMLLLLGLFAVTLRAVSLRIRLTDWPRGTSLVLVFGVLTSLSAFTIMLLPGGRTYFLYNELLNYKAWLDQFIFYFIVLMCIRDVEIAKRCVIYMMIGSVLVVLYAVPEMLEKMGRSTIEKSRILGPHMQSNNFGGFVAYTVLPLIAVFVVFIKDLRAWLLTPYFLLAAKVLITTFSRGAYVAMVVGGFLAGWYRGRGFLAIWTTVLLCLLLVFPSVIPESILARMDTVTSENADSSIPVEEKLDKSSSIRLILWQVGAQMIMEDPFLGKGFKGFPFLKAGYTEFPFAESDPHNMYIYVGAQMGLPALALFLIILAYSFNLGRVLAGNRHDRLIRAIGIGGASATACYAVVCIFGSRAVNLNFTVYFWTYLVVMQVIRQADINANAAREPVRERISAFGIAGAFSRSARRRAAQTGEADGAGADQRVSPSRRMPNTRSGNTRGAAAFQASRAPAEKTAGKRASVRRDSRPGDRPDNRATDQAEVQAGFQAGDGIDKHSEVRADDRSDRAADSQVDGRNDQFEDVPQRNRKRTRRPQKPLQSWRLQR